MTLDQIIDKYQTQKPILPKTPPPKVVVLQLQSSKHIVGWVRAH